jgi:hypothetical protein
VFDLIDVSSTIRAGRFQWGSGATLTIIQNPGLYRVLNAGETTIDLAGGIVKSVAKNCSVDFWTAATVTVTGAAEFQGVFERLETAAEFRSGRFKHTFPGSPVELELIDLSAATDGGVHRYRITNGGKKKFEVRAHDGTSFSDLTAAPLDRDQSVDFQVSQTINRRIGVLAGAGDTVTGIFDYLGRSA